LDTWTRSAPTQRPGDVCNSELLCPLSELKSEEFYNDFLAPDGIEHGMFGILERSRSRMASISLYRDQSRSAFTRCDSDILQFLVPHLQRAFKLHFRLFELRARSEGFEAALDMLPTGIIFFGPKGEVVLMNRSAAALVAERDGLLATCAGLRAERLAESSLLEKTIRQAASTLNGDCLSAGGTVMVSRRSRPPLQVQISPINNARIVTSEPIAAIAFVNDPLRRQRPRHEVLRALYGLTPAECRVALLLGDGHSPREIGQMVGVSFNTVRSQMKSIFFKTNVKRQGELIRLVLNHSVLTVQQE
jgi:DNA-binding CsgD family transcriptional regulator